MADWKEFTWILPVIGGILTLISLATPVAFYTFLTEHANLWMIGYWDGTSHLGRGLVDEIEIINSNGNVSASIAESATPFFICFLGVAIGGIMALVAGVRGLRGKFSKWTNLISGTLMIIFTLLFVQWMDSSYHIFSAPTLVAEGIPGALSLSVELRFGFIGPIIGGVICLLSGLIPNKPRVDTEPRIQ